MARNLYVVVDEDEKHIVRGGFFGKVLYTRKDAVKKKANEQDSYKAYKLTDHGV